MKRIFLTAGALAFAVVCSAQLIVLDNSSFEGTPRDATTPSGWLPCAPGSTPDLLPGPWGVHLEPSNGHSFMGLITREDGTHESVGQRLSAALHPKECYSLVIDLAHSKTYANYFQPLKLRIWGSQSKCGKEQLLGETDFVRHTDWETYTFQFAPKAPIYYIQIEAYYRDGPFSYRGNILLDNIRPIKPCIRASLDDAQEPESLVWRL